MSGKTCPTWDLAMGCRPETWKARLALTGNLFQQHVAAGARLDLLVQRFAWALPNMLKANQTRSVQTNNLNDLKLKIKGVLTWTIPVADGWDLWHWSASEDINLFHQHSWISLPGLHTHCTLRNTSWTFTLAALLWKYGCYWSAGIVTQLFLKNWSQWLVLSKRQPEHLFRRGRRKPHIHICHRHGGCSATRTNSGLQLSCLSAL